MKLGDLLERFSKLQIWSSNGRRAPHKPLLVLWGIGRCLRGEERMVSYPDIDEALTPLLREFGPPRKTVRTDYPFWRLQHDDVWEVRGANRVRVTSSGDAFKDSLRHPDIHGGFPRNIYAKLRENEKHAEQIARSLLDAHFPSSRHYRILQAVGIDLGSVQSRRRRRDSGFRKAVLEAYDHQCAICAFAVQLRDTPVALEAAHIMWHQARGPDEVRNGLALCALHHRLFDEGVFTLSPDRTVVVGRSVQGKGFEESLGRFDSRPILPTTNLDDVPDSRFIKWHAREVFSSPHGPM